MAYFLDSGKIITALVYYLNKKDNKLGKVQRILQIETMRLKKKKEVSSYPLIKGVVGKKRGFGTKSIAYKNRAKSSIVESLNTEKIHELLDTFKILVF